MIRIASATSHAPMLIFAIFAAALIGGLLLVVPVAAEGQVGDGTSGSCYEAALDAKLANGGVITFNCGAAPHTILVTTYKMIGDDTEIRGGGVITISGGDTASLFQVFVDKTLIVRGLGLTRGAGTFGAIENFGQLHISGSRLTGNYADAGAANGGAIVNYGSLNVTNTVMSNNHAGGLGGAIYNDAGATVMLHSSQIYSNSARAGGAGIYNGPGSLVIIGGSHLHFNNVWYPHAGGGGALLNLGVASLADSTLRSNRTATDGGGIYSAGVLTLTGVLVQDNRLSNPYRSGAGLAVGDGTVLASDVQFVGNQAATGGAIANGGAMRLANALIYTNTADGIGGVLNGFGSQAGMLILVNVTLSDNFGDGSSVVSDAGMTRLFYTTVVNNHGGGVGQSGTGQMWLINSVVADNSKGNCNGTVITSDGHNLSSDASCGGWNKPGDQTEKPAGLGPLADNGGPTFTHLPQPGSPLIDGGLCLPEVLTDQRGVARPFGATCDIGAVEWMRLFAFLPVVRR